MSGIKKIHNQLAYDIEAYINGTKYIIDEITIRDLSVINDDMIIGLRFLQQSLQTTIIHEEGVTFIPYQDNVPYISEVRKQRKSLQNVEISNLDDEYSTSPDPLEFCKDEELSETIKEYHIENTCTECIGLQSFLPNWYRDIKSKKDIDKIVQRLESIQIIGEIPMKHWDKNSIVCKINIINPDYIIKSGPIEATPKDIEEFKMHIEELLKLKAIRESRSPHQSAAFIVRNHAEEVRGKSRMVINFKRLNDNTVDDAYSIPNKQEWINRIQGSKYFSKFDLKAGFWQVKMAEESIPWTAFTCPQGHYEWLVMPLGLKNAPALFQRKMQNIFNENQAFILVYVDDLLVFSKSYKEHIAHLEVFFRKVEQNGLILSKKKMEICKEKINFLGHEIGEGKIYLQEHIAKKILEFPDNMSDKKVLQQFLGIVNYARNYIDNLAKLAGPLYAKLRKNGQRYFNSEDIKLVKAIKEKVRNLKPLELPLEDNYFIIETDASKVGWGAILKQKPNKYSPKADEKICRYASGSYKLKTVNNIDREILAVVNAINAFRLYLGFKEFTVRTDCEAICRYYNKIKIMRKGLFANKDEYLFFGEENRLKMFQPNTFNFKPKSHIKLDEAQRCILDNFWFQYTRKREEQGYFLSILSSLAEYFNELNKNVPKPAKVEIPKGETLYLIFDGNKPGIYLEWENIMIEKLDAKRNGQDLTFKRYYSIDEALLWARKVLGPDYYIDPKAKNYIQMKRGIPASPTPTKGEASSSNNIKKQESPKYKTYQECLLKGLDPLDSEYIDQEMDKRFEEFSKIIKKELKEEILKELRQEIDEKFEEIKKECDEKYDFNLLNDDDHMDIAGHGQQPE
ncbi:hypothetical protein VPH35_105882 [Triticum aestivum]